MLATGHWVVKRGGWNGVALWDTPSGKYLAGWPVERLQGHSHYPIQSLAFDRNGDTLAAGTESGTVILWQVNTWRQVGELRGHTDRVVSLGFMPGGRILATASRDGTLRLWDVSGRLIVSRKRPEFGDNAVAFFGQESIFLAGEGLELRRLENWERQREYEPTPSGALCVTVSPHSLKVAVGCEDWKVMVWDVSTGRLEGTFAGHTKAVTCLAFSPNERMLASGSSDRTVRLWDLRKKEQRAVLWDHNGTVLSVEFLSDGQRILSIDSEGVVRTWDVSNGRLMSTLTLTRG